MSEDKPQAAPGQQSFGDAPATPPSESPEPSSAQSFGDAPSPPAPPPPPPVSEPPVIEPPVAAPMPAQPVAQSVGDAPAPTQSMGGAPAPTQTFGEAPVVTPAAPAKRSSALRIVGGVVVALLLLGVIATFVVVRFLNSSPTGNVGVGDCLANVPTVAEGETREVTDARAVDCADAEATHKVEGRYEDKTAQESAEVCAAHPTANFIITTADDSGSRGYVLCLSQLTK